MKGFFQRGTMNAFVHFSVVLFLFTPSALCWVPYSVPTGVRAENSVVYDVDPFLRCDGVAAPFNGRLRFTGLQLSKPAAIRTTNEFLRFTVNPILLANVAAYPRQACNLNSIQRNVLPTTLNRVQLGGRTSLGVTTNADDDSSFMFNGPDNTSEPWSFVFDVELVLGDANQYCMLDCVVVSLILEQYAWNSAAAFQSPSGSVWQAIQINSGSIAPQFRDSPSRLYNIGRHLPEFLSNASAIWPGIPLPDITLPITNMTDTVEAHGLQRIVDAGPCARVTLRLSHRSGVAWIAINGFMVWCGADRHQRCRANNPENPDINLYDVFAQEIDPGNLFLRADRKQVVRVVFYSRARTQRHFDLEVVVQDQVCPPCFQAVSSSLYVDGYQQGCSSNTLSLIGPRSNWSIGAIGNEVDDRNYVYNFTATLSMNAPLPSQANNELRVARLALPPLLPTCNAVTVAAFFVSDVLTVVGNQTIFPCPSQFRCDSALLPRNYQFEGGAPRSLRATLNLTSVDRSRPIELTVFYTVNWLRPSTAAPVIVATVPVSEVAACFVLPTPAPTPEATTTTLVNVAPVTTFVTQTTVTGTVGGSGATSSASDNPNVNITTTEPDNTTLIVAIVVSLVVLLLLVLLCLFFVRRRRAQRNEEVGGEVTMAPTPSSAAFGRYGGLPQQDTDYDSGTLKMKEGNAGILVGRSGERHDAGEQRNKVTGGGNVWLDAQVAGIGNAAVFADGNERQAGDAKG
jgi:hypothetical protein